MPEQKRSTICDRRSESLVRKSGIRIELWIRRRKINQAKKMERESTKLVYSVFKHLQGVKYSQGIGVQQKSDKGRG